MAIGFVGTARVAAFALVACGGQTGSDVRGPGPATTDPATAPPSTDTAGGGETGETGDTGQGGETGETGSTVPCPLGLACNPIPIVPLPFTDARDTLDAPGAELDAYACAPGTDESGPEFLYAIELGARSLFSAAVDDVSGDGVDVDLHLLDAPEPGACLARDNIGVFGLLEPGTYYLSADTWVDGSGVELAGPYELQADVRPVATSDCAVEPVDLRMYWTSCAAGVDCYGAVDPSDGEYYIWLRTPATGPVALEAHLVTEGETFAAGWPTSSRDQIDRHYALSQAASRVVLERDQDWAPAGEGGSEYGQGSTGAPVPAEAEAWYVNMYWRDRPEKGTRMIVTNPANGRSVVAAAGYETGPYDHTVIGGVVDEVHTYLGTGHVDDLTLGFAVDQTLPYGPISCQ